MPRPHVARVVHFDLLAKLLDDDRRSQPADEWLAQLRDPGRAHCIASQPSPLVGEIAPDFTLVDHQNQPWTLHSQTARGPVVLVFYLGNSCNACLHNLYELSADRPRFRRWQAEVVAVSGDPPESARRHFERFGGLDLTVLADTERAAARAFGAWRECDGEEPAQPMHATFVIERGGRVRWAYRGDLPFTDNLALLYELATGDGEVATAAGRETP